MLAIPEQSSEQKTSITGKLWNTGQPDERLILSLTQRFDLSPILARLLTLRGIDLDSTESYLTPTLRTLMPDPSTLIDMDKAVHKVIDAIQKKKKIVAYGDYDVDGATSSALLRRYFHDIDHPIELYIPDRIEEGYGANTQALQSLAKKGISLVLMSDCGTTAFEPLASGKQFGLDIIVLDHHTAQASLPEAAAIINPNRLDDNSGLGNLCAAAVTFFFITALHRALKEQGWFTSRTEPNLLNYLDLVALGTVCDVMPLTGLNRAFVTQGLKVLHRRSNLGLATLADVSGISEAISAYHLGFILGPRINAGGRVGEASLGSRLLTTLDPTEARQIAQKLDQLNKERQAIEVDVLASALQQIEEKELDQHPVILVAGDGWHPGVIGIVASRLKERFHRPACVVAFEGDIGKGSGRSILGAELGAAMHAAVHNGLLTNGGGHAMAAGFTVTRSSYQDFHDFLNQYLKKQIADIIPALKLDASLTLRGINLSLLNELKQLEPFGNGNASPRFVFHHVRASYADIIGGQHIRCTLTSEDGTKAKAIAFRAADQNLGNFLLTARDKLINVAGTLKLDTWGGKQQITLIIEDDMLA